MKYNKSHAGGYVRVIKDGEHQEVKYRVGEIWQIRTDYGHIGNIHLFVTRKGKNTMLCIDSSASYGIECEWVGMHIPIEEPNYQIF